jgi:hypothetical protein
MHAVVSKQLLHSCKWIDIIVCKLTVDLTKLMLMFVDGASHVATCAVLFCLSIL